MSLLVSFIGVRLTIWMDGGGGCWFAHEIHYYDGGSRMFFFILFGGMFTNEPYCLSLCGMSSVVSRMFRM